MQFVLYELRLYCTTLCCGEDLKISVIQKLELTKPREKKAIELAGHRTCLVPTIFESGSVRPQRLIGLI